MSKDDTKNAGDLKMSDMTLRDHFAGQAMVALIPRTAEGAETLLETAKQFNMDAAQFTAIAAYGAASAMLAARERVDERVKMRAWTAANTALAALRTP